MAKPEACAAGFADWAAVCAFALTLPATELASFYGTPTPKVGGKAFVASGQEPDTSFVLMTSLDAKAMLIETQPETFWETDHYRGWPAVLVRFGTGERDWIGTLIARAWWAKAPAALRKAHPGLSH